MTAAPALDPFYRPIHLAETGSTNDDARRLAADGAPEGTLVWADRQTAGRGRRGRRWESAPGNLYVSLLLRPAAPLAMVGQLGFAAGLAIAEAAAGFVPAGRRIACKWPNDVLGDGRKLAGLLLEAEPAPDGTAAWLVVGLGVNVAHHPDGVEFPATSLGALGAHVTVGEMLSAVSVRLLQRYRRWQAEGFAPLREAWLARAAGLGRPVRVRLEGATHDGVFSGLDADGALLLHRPGQGAVPLRVTAGDLFFPQASEPR